MSDTPQHGTPLGRTLRLLHPHIKGSRGIAGLGVAAIFIEVAARLLEPWPISWVIDTIGARVLSGGDTAAATADGSGASWLAEANSYTLLMLAGAAVIVITVVRAASSYLSSVSFANVGAQVSTRLRAHVHSKLLDAPTSFHSQARSGDLVTRVVSDVNRIQEAGVTAGLPLVANVVTALGMLVVITWLDPILTLAVLGVLPLLAFTGKRTGGRITSASRAQRKREGQLAGDASEAFGAIRTVQAYGLGTMLTDSFAAADKKGLREGVKAKRLSAALERKTDLVVGIATGIVLGLGGHRVLVGAITPGELVVFITYLKTTFKPLRTIAKHVGRISRASASGERIADTLVDARPDPVPSWTRPLPEPARALVRSGAPLLGRIEVRDVVVGYEPGRPVLRGANLVVPPGQRVALVGASGAGKSTLMSVLLRFLRVERGEVRLDGHNLDDVTDESVRAATAVVLQESAVWAGTLADNVRMGRLDATDEEVEQALRHANLGDFVDAHPDGIDRTVGERGQTMSGGQRQRLAVARAMVRDPRVVLLDEPSTGLDAESTEALVAALASLCEGRTTVVVTHDERLMPLVDRVVEVRDGRLHDIDLVSALAGDLVGDAGETR